MGRATPRPARAAAWWMRLSEQRLNHHTEVVFGVLADECGLMLSKFFALRRAQQKADQVKPA